MVEGELKIIITRSFQGIDGKNKSSSVADCIKNIKQIATIVKTWNIIHNYFVATYLLEEASSNRLGNLLRLFELQP